MRTLYRRTFIYLLLGSILSATTHAAEWKIDPNVQFHAGYNDNVTFGTDDEVSSAEATLSPSALFSAETPTSGLSGNLRLDFRRFEDDSNLNDDNVRFDIQSFRRMERSELGLGASLIKDTTLDSQLEETGLVFDRSNRFSTSLNPSWNYNPNPRTRVEAGYTYTNVDYSNTGGTGFVDFTLNSAQASLNRFLNERTTTSITLSRTKSDNDNDVESTNTGLQGGASYQFNETLSASLFAGVRRTEVDFSQNSSVPIFSGNTIIGFVPLTQDVSASDWGSTFSASITKSFLRGEIALSASRDISNDINGRPVEVTRLRSASLYRFTEIFSANLKLEFSNTETNNDVASSLNRDYLQVEPTFNWDFKKFWRISGSYRYRKQTFDSTDGDAVQNSAYLTLGYRWPRIAVSR